MANTDLTIQDIILRYETLSPLTTKGSKLTKSEYDTSLMGIFNDCLRLMTMYDSASWNMADGTAITFGSKTPVDGQIKATVIDGNFKLQRYNGTFYVDMFEIECLSTGGVLKQSNRAAYNGGSVTVTLNDSTYEHITNVGNDYLEEVLTSPYFTLANDVITVGGIPAGYAALCKVQMTAQSQGGFGTLFKLLTREYNLYSSTPVLFDIFEIENGDEIKIQFKLSSGGSASTIYDFTALELEVLSLIPVSP